MTSKRFLEGRMQIYLFINSYFFLCLFVLLFICSPSCFIPFLWQSPFIPFCLSSIYNAFSFPPMPCVTFPTHSLFSFFSPYLLLFWCSLTRPVLDASNLTFTLCKKRLVIVSLSCSLPPSLFLPSSESTKYLRL